MKEEIKIASERKYLTVLFADISQYNTLIDRLDPEEVMEISNLIFHQASKIIENYEGHIERVFGDEILVFFGVPRTFEDTAVRAIHAALNIHSMVKSLDSQFRERAGIPLRMHSGISSGLVVTGRTDIGSGKDGFAGRPINIASYLKTISGPDEILVGHDTYGQSEGFFDYEWLGLQKIKTNSIPVAAYKVLTAKAQPVKLHRPSGLKAELIGRNAEMKQIQDGIGKTKTGPPKTYCISGKAGIGKTRLIEEYKGRMESSGIQWLEGHAYAYTQSTPFYPFLNLLNRVLEIREGDSADTLKAKLKSKIRELIDDDASWMDVGTLYGLNDLVKGHVCPELIRSRIYTAVGKIFNALANRAPTIFCFEDIHWADTSSLELFQEIRDSIKSAVAFIYSYRPPFEPFTDAAGNHTREIIHLAGLSPVDMHRMLESILDSTKVPAELKDFVRQKAAGTPFFLEELVNSLIESGMLMRSDACWKLAGSLESLGLPATIHGILLTRFDKLEITIKKILQEAAVIGRLFSVKLLQAISERKDSIDYAIDVLVRHDFIRLNLRSSGAEYTFRHVLTHEVIYDSILLKKRRLIHNRVGRAIEDLYPELRNEFSEMLAYHFSKAGSTQKGVDYHLKSASKATRKYSLDEADRHCQEAFLLVETQVGTSPTAARLLVDVLNAWGFVYYWRADHRNLIKLFRNHQKLAESLNDSKRLAMFYCWLGLSLHGREKLEESHQYLLKALKLAGEVKDEKGIGYACAWLSWACSDLGLIDEAVQYGHRAKEISIRLKREHLYLDSMNGLGRAYFFLGDCKLTRGVGEKLLEHAGQTLDLRSEASGHIFIGTSYLTDGNLPQAIVSFKKAASLSKDPGYLYAVMIFLGLAYVANGQLREAEDVLEKVKAFDRKFGVETFGTAAHGLSGIVEMAKGNLNTGLKRIARQTIKCFENQSLYRYAAGEYMLGKVYLELVARKKPMDLILMIKNIGFFIKVLPFAMKKAEDHLKKSIDGAIRIGAKNIAGQSLLELGNLYRTAKHFEKAKDCFVRAEELFTACSAGTYLNQTREALFSLK